VDHDGSSICADGNTGVNATDHQDFCLEYRLPIHWSPLGSARCRRNSRNKRGRRRTISRCSRRLFPRGRSSCRSHRPQAPLSGKTCSRPGIDHVGKPCENATRAHPRNIRDTGCTITAQTAKNDSYHTKPHFAVALPAGIERSRDAPVEPERRYWAARGAAHDRVGAPAGYATRDRHEAPGACLPAYAAEVRARPENPKRPMSSQRNDQVTAVVCEPHAFLVFADRSAGFAVMTGGGSSDRD
jgi:hypothetical protein